MEGLLSTGPTPSSLLYISCLCQHSGCSSQFWFIFNIIVEGSFIELCVVSLDMHDDKMCYQHNLFLATFNCYEPVRVALPIFILALKPLVLLSLWFCVLLCPLLLQLHCWTQMSWGWRVGPQRALLPANSGMTTSDRIIPLSRFVPAHIKTTIGPSSHDEHLSSLGTHVCWATLNNTQPEINGFIKSLIHPPPKSISTTKVL